MITSLRLLDFKSFADERLRMGPFTVVAGANASGKSNIRDALRFLHGLGRGYTLAEILGGKYGPGGEVQWDGIRGAPGEVVRIEQDGEAGENGFALEVEMQLQLDIANSTPSKITYKIRSEGASGSFRVTEESLRCPHRHSPFGWNQHKKHFVYNSHPPPPDPVRKQDDERHLLLRMAKTATQRKYGHRIEARPDQPALAQMHEHKKALRLHKTQAQVVADSFASMRFLDPSPNRMRMPSFPGQTTLGDRGDNLPTVLKDICDDSDRRGALIDWTRELTPMDVADFEFPRDPVSGKVQLRITERSGRRISAYSASDGTLRFLAILAALFGKDQAELYFFEEIDNGIHPSRLRLLLELIENWTAERGSQVVTTTHSPELLAMVSNQTFKNTAVVCRRPDTGDAVIRQVAELSNAKELWESQELGTLHASGWMEDAVFLGEGASEPEAGS